ncbi:MAG: sulfatase-like hydrolase/transferase [Myxococcota bacterium]|nr:sulfatase-like hydrolase/transferase [Myxococcota bacterium]
MAMQDEGGEHRTKTRSGFRGAWAVLLLACTLLVSVADAVLLEISKTFFTAGFNGVYLEGAGAVGVFAAGSLLIDLCLVTGVWALMLPLVKGRPGSVWQKLLVVSLASLALPLSVDFVNYQVGLVLGRAVSFPILWEVAGGGVRLILAEASPHAGPLLAVLVAAAAAATAMVWAIGRIQRRRKWGDAAVRPGARPFAKAFAGLLLCSSLLLVGIAWGAPRVNVGLSAKPSGSLLVGLLDFVTDVDRDGFGLLSRPADPAPFDADRHPYAVDVPGNGVDENGFAGDRPEGTKAAPRELPGPVSAAHSRRPDFLLVYLESFRADRLGARRNGREITPFMNALAREGSSSQHAYVNSPYTVRSRAQLYGGNLDPRPGQMTLVDDFNQLGYTTAHLSGQDDSFGGSVELLGLDRVDYFYDAREDAALRTSRSTNAGSLQVSSKLLVRRVGEYLDGYPADRPLFLYVNLVDTHFPYTHDETDDLLGVSPLSRYDIRAANAENVRAAYDNTAANVDLAVRRIVERFREAVGQRDHAILVTSDHGQALFEDGLLGHGQALGDDQTRAPFVLFGIGGDWPQPLGMADVRGLLLRSLFVPPGDALPKARFVADPLRRVFHFVAQIHHPHIIALRTLEGLTSFSLNRSSLESFDANGSPRSLDERAEMRAFQDLIWTWEATRAAIDESGDAREPHDEPGPA